MARRALSMSPPRSLSPPARLARLAASAGPSGLAAAPAKRPRLLDDDDDDQQPGSPDTSNNDNDNANANDNDNGDDDDDNDWGAADQGPARRADGFFYFKGQRVDEEFELADTFKPPLWLGGQDRKNYYQQMSDGDKAAGTGASAAAAAVAKRTEMLAAAAAKKAFCLGPKRNATVGRIGWNCLLYLSREAIDGGWRRFGRGDAAQVFLFEGAAGAEPQHVVTTLASVSPAAGGAAKVVLSASNSGVASLKGAFVHTIMVAEATILAVADPAMMAPPPPPLLVATPSIGADDRLLVEHIIEVARPIVTAAELELVPGGGRRSSQAAPQLRLSVLQSSRRSMLALPAAGTAVELAAEVVQDARAPPALRLAGAKALLALAEEGSSAPPALATTAQQLLAKAGVRASIEGAAAAAIVEAGDGAADVADAAADLPWSA